ncbi:TAP-like protein-domain-containing protein [Calycina marina]|uniref:TAP-like protein-domain-containing protein n=1 Tax=Calycina marina TaxID=1763456 RepID=A0A9P7Z4S8_9HELO|nr:TAP-like protein-domain-containing protein [Calycina marina]
MSSGPGESAVDFLIQAAPISQNITGGHYDIVSWEPRGLGQSIPAANCTNSTSPSISYHKLLVRGNGSDFEERSFAEAVQEHATIVGHECKATIAGPTDAAPHMTTKVVVQDMISILDAYAKTPEGKLVEDPMHLNYWGFSYGTIIGQTFASMHPYRINRVVLDGVVDADDYTNVKMETWLLDADVTFTSFFVYCHLAGSEACPYYIGNSAGDIFSRFERTVARLDAKTARAQSWENATLIESTLTGLKVIAFRFMYVPLGSFSDMAEVLVLLETASHNLTMESFSAMHNSVQNSTGEAFGDTNVAQVAISCSDNGNKLFNRSLEEVEPIVGKLKSQSWVGGEPLSKNLIACTGWGIDGVDRYAGPFGGRTKNPMLFVSNTRDPVTPKINGQRAATLFEGSQSLVTDGTGHTSLAVINVCALRKIGAYFQNGTMPGCDNFCDQGMGPWNVTIPGGLEKRGDWNDLQARMKALR